MSKNYDQSIYYNANYHYTNIQNKDGGDDGEKMNGSRRVIIFCLLTTVLPTILIVLPLYLKNIHYAAVMYKISDSDVIQIHQGQSSIFCQKHSLTMNNSFNAFQMKGRPDLSNKRKHIRLKKSMVLPDDTLEYWGFYLFSGATVELKACSRYQGSKVLVVKGEKTLNTCGILDGNNKNKRDPKLVENQGRVLVTLETPANKQDQKPNHTNNASNEQFNTAEEDKFDEHSKLNTSKTGAEWLDNSDLNDIYQRNTQERHKRDVKGPPLHHPNTVLDAGVNHGGNAFNTTATGQDSSVSSFENSLHECYSGNILINEYFPFSIQCNSTNYLENTTILKVTHEVLLDGYYYYIFYSDNDIVQNDIHVIFDIYKPTFQYANMSTSKVCINQTDCEFSVSFFSDELVIVEVPTKDGINNDKDDISILMSVCHPRTSVYVFFPVTVLLMIMLFAFL